MEEDPCAETSASSTTSSRPPTVRKYARRRLQYVRKVSGSTKPSRANAAAFEQAVDAVAEATARLLEELTTTAPARDREAEAEKARERWQQRQERMAAG